MPETTSDAGKGPAQAGLAVPFAAGFRPFFLATGIYGALAIPLWLAGYLGHLPLGVDWHGHEMIFGFAGAALAGFVLTAIPNWTGRPGVRGPWLAALVAAWLAGRVALAVDAAPLADLALLTALGLYAAVALAAAGNRRNYGVAALILLLSACNAVYHVHDRTLGLHAAIWILIAMITLIGGRIVPAFTQNALRAAGDPDVVCTTPRRLEQVILPAIIAAGAVHLVAPDTPVAGAVAGAAGIALAVRMLGWRSARTWRMPIVWVLHVGHAWIPLGLILLATSALAGWPGPSAALHALTAGAIGTMILAVASRAALGHLGRPLRAAPVTVAAYGCVIAGAAIRVVATAPEAMVAGGALWSLGYALFTAAYAPLLVAPRADGRPG